MRKTWKGKWKPLHITDLGQVSVVIAGWTGIQCLIAAFYLSYSSSSFRSYLSSCNATAFHEGHSSPVENGAKKHLFSDLKALQRQLCNYYYRTEIRHGFLPAACRIFRIIIWQSYSFWQSWRWKYIISENEGIFIINLYIVENSIS